MVVSRIGVHESTAIDFPFEAMADELANAGPDVVPVGDDAAELTDCDAVVTFTHRDPILDAAPKWVHTTQAGVDGFPLDEYERRGIALTNSTGLHGESVGETAVCLMLLLARRVHAFVKNQTRRVWEFPEWDEAFTVGGKRACVVGLGTVGRGVAERASALGMDVVGVRRTPEPVPGVDEVYPPERLHDAIDGSTFLVLAVPLTDETRGLVGADELDLLGPDGYLVNVARGPVVDEDALLAALREDRIGGGALDVFDEEPLPEDHPFWGMDDVVVTPHAAVANRSFYLAVADLLRENLARFEAGESLENQVV